MGDIARVKFPSGEPLDKFRVTIQGWLSTPAKGNYLLVHQFSNPSVVVIDLKTKNTVMVYNKPGFNIYDNLYAGESASGELGVRNLADKKYMGGIDLPEGPLDTASLIAFSPDGKWLAMSGDARGGIWNLESGERTHLTAQLEGAFFDQDQLLAKAAKPSAVFKFDLASSKEQNLYK